VRGEEGREGRGGEGKRRTEGKVREERI